jgi:hypothetical protein
MPTKPVLSPRVLRELAEHNPIGMRLTEADVEAWFDMVWLSFSTYNYRNTRRAVIRWWSRVSESEIQRARQRAARIADESEVAALERQSALDATAAADNVVAVDFASRLTG